MSLSRNSDVLIINKAKHADEVVFNWFFFHIYGCKISEFFQPGHYVVLFLNLCNIFKIIRKKLIRWNFLFSVVHPRRCWLSLGSLVIILFVLAAQESTTSWYPLGLKSYFPGEERGEENFRVIVGKLPIPRVGLQN